MMKSLIDIGTNSVKLVIYNDDEGMITVQQEEREIIELGNDSFETRKITDEKISKLFVVLGRYIKLANARGSQLIELFATSAIRESKNREEITKRIYSEFGLKLTVLSGESEAQMVFNAILNYHPHITNENLLTIDIGGGSAEIIYSKNGELTNCTSLPLGGLRIKEIFLHDDQINAEEVVLMEKYILRVASSFLYSFHKNDISKIIFTGGTANSIAKNIKSRLPAKEGLLPLSLKDLSLLREQLCKLTKEERYNRYEFDQGRAELSIPTISLMKVILGHLDKSICYVSKVGLREGILSLKGSKGEICSTHQIEIALLQILKKFDADIPHSQTVNRLSLSLFDQTQKLHCLEPHHRHLLHMASLLHDVGQYIDYNKHHKHSQYIIENVPILGVSENDKKIVSLIARYHRKATPSPKHVEFTSLALIDREIVLKLSALLRIADALDRGHNNAVKSLQIKESTSKITFIIDGEGDDISLELWALNEKKKLFEEIFQKQISITAVK